MSTSANNPVTTAAGRKPVSTNPASSTPSRATILQDVRQAEGRMMTFLMGMEKRLGSKIDALKISTDALTKSIEALTSGDVQQLEALATKIKSNAAALAQAVQANTPKV